THFADENNFRRLTQSRTKRRCKIRCVRMKLALMDRTELVFVAEFDRVFDRDDVIFLCRINKINNRGERRRFTRTGRAGNEHEAVLQSSARTNRRRPVQILPVLHSRRNYALYDRLRSALFENIYTTSAKPRAAVRNIGRSLFIERLGSLFVAFEHYL